MPLRVSKIREKKISTDDDLLEFDMSEADPDDQGSTRLPPSPSGGKLYTATTISVEKMIRGKCLLEQEKILQEELLARHTWRYVVYNELAKVQYKLFIELLDEKKISDANTKATECLQSIATARELVLKSKNAANSNLKSVVHYNYSQFVYALSLQDQSALQESLKAVNKAIEMYSSSKEYYQDSLVHRSFVLMGLNKKEEAIKDYKDAFHISPERFVSEYTTDGSGKELVDYIIANDLDDVLQELSKLKASLPNFSINDTDYWSHLQSAVQHGSSPKIIKLLLQLGANPLDKLDGEDRKPLFEAIYQGKWDIAYEMLSSLKVHNKVLEVSIAELESAISDYLSSNDDQDIGTLIESLSDRYGLKCFLNKPTVLADLGCSASAIDACVGTDDITIVLGVVDTVKTE